jgi:hypothetical protein
MQRTGAVFPTIKFFVGVILAVDYMLAFILSGSCMANWLAHVLDAKKFILNFKKKETKVTRLMEGECHSYISSHITFLSVFVMNISYTYVGAWYLIIHPCMHCILPFVLLVAL